MVRTTFLEEFYENTKFFTRLYSISFFFIYIHCIVCLFFNETKKYLYSWFTLIVKNALVFLKHKATSHNFVLQWIYNYKATLDVLQLHFWYHILLRVNRVVLKILDGIAILLFRRNLVKFNDQISIVKNDVIMLLFIRNNMRSKMDFANKLLWIVKANFQ